MVSHCIHCIHRLSERIWPFFDLTSLEAIVICSIDIPLCCLGPEFSSGFVVGCVNVVSFAFIIMQICMGYFCRFPIFYPDFLKLQSVFPSHCFFSILNYTYRYKKIQKGITFKKKGKSSTTLSRVSRFFGTTAAQVTSETFG